ncbi:Sphingolipid delta4-desaturase DES1 [Hondaea fermentalgiana]|uniref:Sphingolipid delta4-desaturase DES1 n=1 Tax=Hondaea fermentalgiana TaxID=2315210 RepID=A0A2R5G5I5_9STRA|nr:Sphingolipid delta4-desaturase DES1 [Hondaea fermentalgiana]|eukprot:GBG26296.1 Sphingolipid delta4-desaturase DES1 [Hondaea fermentalgiana]
MTRLADAGMHTTCLCLGKWARGALFDARKCLAKESSSPSSPETAWIAEYEDQVDLLEAVAHLSMGHLSGTLQTVNRVIKRNADSFAVARCLQLRAHVMVLVGVDKLGEEDIRECLRVLQGGTWRLSLDGDDLAPAVLPPIPDMQMAFSAADWHRTRRKLMQDRYPEIKQLYETRSGFPGDGFYEAVLLLAIFASHVCMVFVVSYLQSALAVLMLSATFGAAAVYGFQALNHDLSHVTRVPGIRYLAMVLSSSLCVFPWAMYYQNYHAVHHAFTGTDMDRDGDILFQPWYSPPRFEVLVNRTRPRRSRFVLKRWSEYFEDEAALEAHEALVREFADAGDKYWAWSIDLSSSWQTRFLWSVIVPTFMYVMFLVRKLLLDRAHRPMIQYEGLMLIAQILCWRVGGIYALAYVWLSGSFSHGGACHPYFGFWLIQHENTWRQPELDEDLFQFKEALSMHKTWRPQAQPTISYTGSCLWQYANFGELQHVEHHDFPMIPARHYPLLRTMAPEFFQNLVTRDSIIDAIKTWLFAPSDETWMQQHGDFARRDVFIEDLWMRRYRFPDDTEEAAEALLDRITNPHHRSVTMGTCYACSGPIRAVGRNSRGLIVVRGAALSVLEQDPVQVLARVRKSKRGAGLTSCRAEVEVIIGDTPARVTDKQRLEVRVPPRMPVIDWFETELAPQFVHGPVRAQVIEDEQDITLYFDSRFMFDCFAAGSDERFENLDQLSDIAQYEFAQSVALDYFGPRRVPSHFRRRQAILVRVHSLIKRHWLRFAWTRLMQRASPSRKVNERLVDLLTRNFARNRRHRCLREVFQAWSTASANRKRRHSLVGRLVNKASFAQKNLAFQALFRNALRSKMDELVYDNQPSQTVNKLISSARREGLDSQGVLSPQSILKYLMERHLDIEGDLVNQVMRSPVKKQQKGSPDVMTPVAKTCVPLPAFGNENADFSRQGHLFREGDESPNEAVGTPSTEMPDAQLPEDDASMISCEDPAFGPSSESEIAGAGYTSCFADTSSKRGNGAMRSEDAEASRRITDSSISSGDSALSAWRQQARGNQERARGVQLGASFSADLSGSSSVRDSLDPLSHACNGGVSGAETERARTQNAKLGHRGWHGRAMERKAAMSRTPLSAGLVSKWQVMSSPSSANSSSSQETYLVGPSTRMRNLSAYEIPETPGPESDSQSSSFTSPALASSAASYNKRRQRQRQEQESQSSASSLGSGVVQLLQTLGLDGFVDRFVEEELTDLSLLVRMCVADKREFKETLREMGIMKIGQRERIVRALLEEHENMQETSSRKSSASKKSKRKKKRKTPKFEQPNVVRALQDSQRRETEANRKISSQSQIQLKKISKKVLQTVQGPLSTSVPRSAQIVAPIDTSKAKQLRAVFRPSGEVEGFQLRCDYYRRLGLKV